METPELNRNLSRLVILSEVESYVEANDRGNKVEHSIVKNSIDTYTGTNAQQRRQGPLIECEGSLILPYLCRTIERATVLLSRLQPNFDNILIASSDASGASTKTELCR